LFGRAEVVQRLAVSGARLTVLSGDSGIGKSEVLRAAQLTTRNAIAPPPRSLPSSGGVLQRVLIDGLGEVLAEDVHSHGRAKEVGRFLGEAAERVVASGGQELVRVIGKEVLAVIRGRLGADVGDAIAAYTSALKTSVDERLAVRLDTALDRSAVELVVTLAKEVLGQLQQGAVLALDAGERLPQEDIRVLGDVADSLPDGLRVRIAVSTYSTEHQATVDRLVGSAHVAEIRLAGIAEAGVGEWLTAEELPGDIAAEVTRVTGGYALHLGDLIAHLKAGGAIDDAPLHEVFARRTEEAWAQLPPEITRHARRLCVFADPLPQDRTLELLELDAAAWGDAQERLRRARIFSVDVNGSSWFHEQRRRYLSEVKLDDAERAAASTDAIAALRSLTEDTQRVDRLAEFAAIMRYATPLLEGSESLRAVLELDVPELSLCASFVELIEPRMEFRALDGNTLLRHARQVFDPGGDLVGALRELVLTPLAFLVENNHAALVAPVFNDLAIVLFIIGRSQRDLGRTPIPKAASAVYETEIRPRLGPHLASGYGIGPTRMANLGERAVELRRRLRAPVFIGGRDAGPNLLMRGNYAGRAFYAHVCFESVDARNEARERLDGLEAEIFDQHFDLKDLIAHPGDPVPASRFLRAAARLLRGQLKLENDGTGASRDLGTPTAVEQRLALRAAVLKLVRERSSTIERYATELDQPIGFLYLGEGERTEIAEVLGGREDSRPAPEAFARPREDPFEIYRIEDLGQLAPNERVGLATFSLSQQPRSDDPALETLTDLAKRAVRFNATQRRLAVSVDAQDLKDRIQQAVNTRLDDARALYESGVFGEGIEQPVPRSYEVLLAPVPQDAPGLFAERWWSGRVITRKTSLDRDEVSVRVMEGGLASLVDGMPEGDFVTCTQSSAENIIAALLGYQEGDLDFSVSPGR
jgi:hypothetical protein